jgi:hypothetical protein
MQLIQAALTLANPELLGVNVGLVIEARNEPLRQSCAFARGEL